MPNKTHRVVFDTNIIVYFLISKNFNKLESKIKNGQVTFIFSDELMTEILLVLKRPKFKKYFTQQEIQELIKSLTIHSELIEVKSNIEMCRVPKDNFLLSLCFDSNANFLITGDDDLLSLKKIGKTKIITIKEYVDR
jgi:putative PIN family toxin of toxin-antitoxin system